MKLTFETDKIDFDYEDAFHPNVSSPNPKHNPFSITNDEGNTFQMRILSNGTKYGRNNVLTHGEEQVWSIEEQKRVDPTKYDGDVIEFYDTYNTDNKGDWQFVSRYYVKTLLYDFTTGEPKTPGEYGLDLAGQEPKWGIDAKAMGEILNHLKNNEDKFDFGGVKS
jgi:hypothetical protein